MSQPATKAEIMVELREQISSYIGVQVPSQAISEIFGTEESLFAEIRHFGLSDTCVLDSAMDVFAIEVVGRPWPTYGAKDQRAQRFQDDLTAAIAARGWPALASA